MTSATKPRLVGFNHVAIEVGDIEEALAFYGKLFTFELRSREPGMAFIDLGDQFIALQKGRKQAPDDGRHFGLVVDDKQAARQALKEAGVKTLPGPFLDFREAEEHPAARIENGRRISTRGQRRFPGHQQRIPGFHHLRVAPSAATVPTLFPL